MKRNIFLIFLISLAIIGCKTQEKNNPENRNILGHQEGVKKINPNTNVNKTSTFSKEVLELNEQATLLINNRTEKDYQAALNLLDSAISIDSMYYMAYSNKVTVLIKLKKYTDAIETCQYITTNVKEDYPEAYTMLGMLYDKTGKKSVAESNYNKAIKKYSDRIKQKNNVLDMVNKAHLIYILDKEKGLEEIDSLIKTHPSDEELPMYKEYLFLKYNHQKALDEL